MISVSIKSGELVSSVPVQSFSIIPGQGILIYRNSIDGNGFKFPTGENNVIITYKSGYDYSTIPSDIKLAISYIALYNILQDEMLLPVVVDQLAWYHIHNPMGQKENFLRLRKAY